MRALLVGLGRMGCRYRDALERHFGEDLFLASVDPKVSTDIATNHYSHIRELPSHLTFDLAIDARPNQDRLTLFELFLERNIPYIVVEKPHATSISESTRMIELLEAQPKPPKVLMPFYERYGEHYLPETLQQLQAGALKSIVISAGAIGLGCNGIHYIDLANYLFGAVPQEVYARLLPNTVPSPRGNQFVDHAGTILSHYPQGDFILHMRPDSSVGTNITLVYEHGKIQIAEQIDPTMTWLRQPEETWQDPFYRTHRETIITPPCLFKKDLVDHMIPAALRDMLKGNSFPDIYDGHKALRVIALAMVSHLERRPMAWSEEQNAISELSFAFT